MSCGVGHRRGSDLAWLWCRLVATAPIRPLAWEPPYATGVALKRQKDKKKIKNKKILWIKYYVFEICFITIHVWCGGVRSTDEIRLPYIDNC